MSLVVRAEVKATEAHQGQEYGGGPYTKLLRLVTHLLIEHGFCSPEYLAAGWLHDVVEDTDLTIEEVEAEFGSEVARLVAAVTQEPGKNRKERIAATLSKTATCERAIPLKLADRIANVESCWATRDSRLFMYKREYRDFRRALRKPHAPQNVKAMWDQLDKLLGWWEPPA